MKVRELKNALQHLMDQNLGEMPAVIETESGTRAIKQVIVRDDRLASYCTVVELSPDPVPFETKD